MKKELIPFIYFDGLQLREAMAMTDEIKKQSCWARPCRQKSMSLWLLWSSSTPCRSAKVPSNVPTACVVTGSEAPELLYSGDLQDKEQLYVFFENLQSVRLTSGRDLSAFLRDREPWEDYDICVFEEGLEWAAFLTHDDRTVLIDPHGRLVPY